MFFIMSPRFVGKHTAIMLLLAGPVAGCIAAPVSQVNADSNSVRASIQRTTAAPALTVTSPSARSSVAGTMTIAGTAPGYLNVEVSFGGVLLGRTTPSESGAFSVAVSTTSLSNGAQTLVLNAWNSPAGTAYTLTTRTDLTVTVANVTASAAARTVPLSVSSPVQNSSVKGMLTLTGSASGFLNVEVSFNGILFGRATPSSSGAFSVAFSTSSLPDGPQTLLINAWNSSAGQSFTRTTQLALNVNVANGSVNITDFGAIADGTTDNFAAITAAIAAAQAKGVAVFVPAGTFAYGNVIRLTGVKLFGQGDTSILYAQDWSHESIFLYGDGPEVRQLLLTGVQAPARVAPWEATRITIFGATHFVIDHVTIHGSAAAGIQTAQSANNGKITNNAVFNTLSDSIHITDKASYLTVSGNHVENSGDDGIAVVSYLNDGDYVSNITATNNTVLNNLWGRNMSVVGGSNISYQNNDLVGNANFACLYLAQEGSYNTFGDVNVSAQSNTMQACGSQSTGHGAIMLITTGSGQNVNVQLVGNQIIQFGNAGMRVFGANSNVVIEDNEIAGASPAYDVETPGISYSVYTSGIVGYSPAPSEPIS